MNARPGRAPPSGEPGPPEAERREAELARSAPLESLTIDRSFPGPADRVWAMWATREGFQRWFGPEDLVGSIEQFDPRPGGALEVRCVYVAVFEDPGRRSEFEAAGVPVDVTMRGTFTEVVPMERIGFELRVAFGSRAPPTRLGMRAEFRVDGSGVRMVLTVSGTSTAHWRTLARSSLEGQVDRMAHALTARADERATPPASRRSTLR